ncbi:MAG: hypothetical protein Q8L47_02965 [bacterium]|nr:hypothetical protein [bacterium]
MTQFALVYILKNIFSQTAEFFTHWYIGGYRAISRHLIDFLEELDRTIAFRITLHYFGAPLFQDRTIIGYILGFVFRSFRLLLGGLFYIVVIALAICIYIAWAGIPLFIIYKIFNF